MKRGLIQVCSFLSSLWLALLLLSGLAGALVVATFIESIWDTPTAQYWVYRASWFRGLLFLLGVNVWGVMWSRWPWKRKHLPFLLAHVGILVLLFGGWLTERQGLDGTLLLEEGEASPQVELDQPLFSLAKGGQARAYPLVWRPPHWDWTFQPIDLQPPQDGLFRLSRWVSRAEPRSFLEADLRPVTAGNESQPALLLKLQGGPMQLSQEIWLWTGSTQTAVQQWGPAQLEWKKGDSLSSKLAQNLTKDVFLGPRLSCQWEGGSVVACQSFPGQEVSSDSKNISSHPRKKSTAPFIRFSASEGESHSFDPGWKGGVRIEFLRVLPHARWVQEFTPVPPQKAYGREAPGSAVEWETTQERGWLGLGDSALVKVGEEEVVVSYRLRRVSLPFALKLERFQVVWDPGTTQPATYTSWVKILSFGENSQGGSTEGVLQLIGMNEPLTYQGYTFYQTSYREQENGRWLSVLTVNYDPGRSIKYMGSFLLSLGCFLFFFKSLRRGTAPSSEKAIVPSLS